MHLGTYVHTHPCTFVHMRLRSRVHTRPCTYAYMHSGTYAHMHLGTMRCEHTCIAVIRAEAYALGTLMEIDARLLARFVPFCMLDLGGASISFACQLDWLPCMVETI